MQPVKEEVTQTLKSGKLCNRISERGKLYTLSFKCIYFSIVNLLNDVDNYALKHLSLKVNNLVNAPSCSVSSWVFSADISDFRGSLVQED